MQFAFNQMGSRSDDENKNNSGGSSPAYKRLLARIYDQRKEDPHAVIELSQSDFEIMNHGVFVESRSFGADRMGALEFRWNALWEGDSSWIGFAETPFRIEGIEGVHLGTDLNYIFQGMIWHQAGASMSEMNAAIYSYNYAEGVLTFSMRDFRQPPYASRWAEFGYSYAEQLTSGNRGR